MKKKIYVDMSQISELGFFIDNPNEYSVVPIGVRIDAMPIQDKNDEYKYIEKNYGINFIFEDYVPYISFYTIPFVDIFAYDQEGFFVRKDGEVYYIKEGICWRVASNLNDFINNVDSWKNNIIICDDIVVYASKEDALREKNLL